MPTNDTDTEVEDANDEAQADEGRDAPPTPEKERPAETGLESALRKEREEKAAIKRQLFALQKEKEDRARAEAAKRDEQLPELERLRKAEAEARRERAEAEKRAEAVREELVKERIAARVEREAAALFEDPGLAPQLVDYSRLEYDPESKDVLHVKDELARVLKRFPSLAKAAAAKGGTPPRDGQRQGQPNRPPKEVDPYAEAFALGGIS